MTQPSRDHSSSSSLVKCPTQLWLRLYHSEPLFPRVLLLLTEWRCLGIRLKISVPIPGNILHSSTSIVEVENEVAGSALLTQPHSITVMKICFGIARGKSRSSSVNCLKQSHHHPEVSKYMWQNKVCPNICEHTTNEINPNFRLLLKRRHGSRQII